MKTTTVVPTKDEMTINNTHNSHEVFLKFLNSDRIVAVIPLVYRRIRGG